MPDGPTMPPTTPGEPAIPDACIISKRLFDGLDDAMTGPLERQLHLAVGHIAAAILQLEMQGLAQSRAGRGPGGGPMGGPMGAGPMGAGPMGGGPLGMRPMDGGDPLAGPMPGGQDPWGALADFDPFGNLDG